MTCTARHLRRQGGNSQVGVLGETSMAEKESQQSAKDIGLGARHSLLFGGSIPPPSRLDGS